jgi:hypothetical protein
MKARKHKDHVVAFVGDVHRIGTRVALLRAGERGSIFSGEGFGSLDVPGDPQRLEQQPRFAQVADGGFAVTLGMREGGEIETGSSHFEAAVESAERGQRFSEASVCLLEAPALMGDPAQDSLRTAHRKRKRRCEGDLQGLARQLMRPLDLAIVQTGVREPGGGHPMELAETELGEGPRGTL